ncbi:sulfurtransferase [Corynebacterium lizhenjunii]|uniref:Sulfurtransferase n=1 Tax=Corynebacterium lizhenjunii TaxID=2709394 RepID=A0A7T0KEB6_9CORY|nr:sulfurtransferase [Corynebacterium lizhenjunii]QPK78959.1 sulfurtransferase [Corynebacterium lizhenjunii]
MSILVSPRQLHEDIHQGARFTVLASLWEPQEGAAFNQFSSLHIPTAQFCDAAGALAGLPGSQAGRNPLPDPDKLALWFKRWGLRRDRPVVVYDEQRGLFAGRAWWILRWAGVEDVRIVDGGLANWRKQGLPTLTGPGNISVGADMEVRPGSMPTATLADVKAHTGLLIDTREPNRFAGRRENLDLKAGHIPGAVNLPERHLHNPDHTWKSPEQVRDLVAEAGITAAQLESAIIYSGSGNHSALAIAALEWAGLPVPRHFVGGWSQWSADPRNPVERGD